MTLPFRLVRRALPAAMLIALLVSIGCGIRLALLLGEPFPGFVLMWRKEHKLYTVSFATPPDWAGIEAGMAVNDRILCINGYHPSPDSAVYGLDPRYADAQCPNGGKDFAELFRERFASTDRATVDFYIDREGTLKTIKDVPLGRFTLDMLVEIFLPSFLPTLGLLAVSMIVYRANPSAKINVVFVSFITILATLVASQTFSVIITDRLDRMRIPTLILIAPWVPLLGVLFFHLTYLFVDQGPFQVAGRLILPYYVLSFSFSLLGIFVYVMDDSPISFFLDWVYGDFVIMSCIVSGAWGLVSLSWTFFRTPSRRVRRQTGLFLSGTLLALGISLPYLAFFFINAPGFQHIYNVLYLGLVVVAIIAYAILRYQLFASRAKVLVILVTAAFCTVMAYLVYLLLGRMMGFLPVLIAALLTGLGLITRRGPTAFFNRLLRREVLDYQTVTRFSQRVGGLQRIDSLLLQVQQIFQEDLDVEYMDVWLLDAEHQKLGRFCQGELASTISIPSAFAEHLLAHPAPVYTTSSVAADYRALLTDDDSDRVVVWVPLVDRDQAVGLLGLGPRWTGEVYDDQDLQLTGILAQQMALSILNTRQLERLEATSRLIVQAEEKERLKFARELHDTVLQFLLVLTYGLDDLKDRQAGMAAEIVHWQDRISAEADQLRSMLSYLRAPELLVQHGLVTSLRMWIDHVQHETSVIVTLDLADGVEPLLSTEAKVAIYRVFREAIRNALKYAEASLLVVQLHPADDRVCFSIQDDGKGCDLEQALQVGDKGYSSLHDMRTYIENLGGQWEMRSAAGQGTVIEGWVPAVAV